MSQSESGHSESGHSAKILPAVDHQFVDGSGTSRGRGLAETCLDQLEHLVVGDSGEGFLCHGPDLKEHHAIAPHVTVG